MARGLLWDVLLWSYGFQWAAKAATAAGQRADHCRALQGCPQIFLLLPSGLKGEWMGRDPSFGGEGKVRVGDEQESWELLSYLHSCGVGA